MRGRLVLVAAAALLLTAAWGALRPGVVRPIAGRPFPAELDTLARYLAPAAPAPEIDGYAVYLPAAPGRAPAATRAPDAGVALRLSAILITGDRPMAIIDDTPVGPGGSLSGGAEVVAIERDRVVVRDPDGSRRTLRLSPDAGAGPE